MLIPEVPTLQSVLKDIEPRGPKDLVRLWTVQHTDAVTQLLKGSVPLRGREEYAYSDCAQGKRSAYKWMVGQMNERLPRQYQCHGLPVWTLPVQSPCLGDKDQVLEIQVTRERVVFSFHSPWTRLLEIFSCMGEGDEERWPDIWSTQPYLVAGASGVDQKNGDAGNIPSEAECRGSWEQIFDLTLARRVRRLSRYLSPDHLGRVAL